MTVLGALAILERAGLVRSIRGKGVFVRRAGAKGPWRSTRCKHLGFFSYSAPFTLAEDTYYAEVVAGLLEAAAADGHRVTFLQFKPGGELRAVRRQAAELRLHGALLAAVTDREVLLGLRRLGCPAVLADHHLEGIAADCVDLDSFGGARDAVLHLAALGHRRIGFLAAPHPERNPERWAGYRAGLASAGLAPAEEQFVRSGTPNFEGGRELMTRLLAEGAPLPGALFVWSGTMAAGTIQVMRERGLRVPGDASVVTCGSRGFMERFPGITTAVAEGHELGRRALALLVRRAGEPDRPAETVLLPMALEVRGSTAPPAAR